MHYPLANTNELVYFFQIRKLMEKPVERYTYTYLSCWEIPPKCTCLDFPASFCKNALRSYYILRGVLRGAALLLTPWEAKCGAFALSQGAQEEKLVLVWVSLGGPVLAQELCGRVGTGHGECQGFFLYFLRAPPLCCAWVAIYLQIAWDYTHVWRMQVICIHSCKRICLLHFNWYLSLCILCLHSACSLKKKIPWMRKEISPLSESNLKQCPWEKSICLYLQNIFHFEVSVPVNNN